MWYTIFCLVSGILLAITTDRTANAITDKKDAPIIGWRLLLTCWMVIAVSLGFTVDITITEEKKMEQMEQRIEKLEQLIQADTLVVTKMFEEEP